MFLAISRNFPRPTSVPRFQRTERSLVLAEKFPLEVARFFIPFSPDPTDSPAAANIVGGAVNNTSWDREGGLAGHLTENIAFIAERDKRYRLFYRRDIKTS